MNTKLVWRILLLGLALVLISRSGPIHAQQPPAEEERGINRGGETTSMASGAIPIQGKLTDARGFPLNGSYSMTFRLYESATGGTARCADTRTVPVAAGLFSSYIDGCYNVIEGQRLYVGISVGTDPEMTPRHTILAVPYAISLVPGAEVIATYANFPLLHLENDGAGGRGLRAYATGTTGENYGMVGASKSPDGLGGYFYNHDGGTGLKGSSQSTATVERPGPGVFGVSDTGDGVRGESNDTLGRGVFAQNTGQGIALAAYANSLASGAHLYPTLYLVQENANADFVVGASSYWGTRSWRVDRTGKGFFNGGTQSSGADFAEQMAVDGSTKDYAPGDVLVISGQADRTVERSSQPAVSTVIGVYSTHPAILGGAPDKNDPLDGIPVAITGIVPCKVSAENGAIRRGDLLITSSTPGHAMRAGPQPGQGTVLGKALGTLETGVGVIPVLVTLQ